MIDRTIIALGLAREYVWLRPRLAVHRLLGCRGPSCPHVGEDWHWR